MAERTKVSARAVPQRTPTSANVPAIVQNDFDFMIATPLTQPPPPAQVTAISVRAFEEDVCVSGVIIFLRLPWCIVIDGDYLPVASLRLCQSMIARGLTIKATHLPNWRSRAKNLESDDVVATSREGHHTPRSDPAGQHQRRHRGRDRRRKWRSRSNQTSKTARTRM